MKIRKGDDVLVLSGKFRGERAQVEEAIPASQSARQVRRRGMAITSAVRNHASAARSSVSDEIIGLQITMLPVAINVLDLCVGFVLFRVFDILKPFPINTLQKLPGGWGVVIDDVAAGIYAAMIMRLLMFGGIL